MGPTELEFYKKQLESKIFKVKQGNVVVTNFLDIQQQAILQQYEKEDAKILFDGGFLNAERKRAILFPKELSVHSAKVQIFQIKYNKRFLTLNHRKILGSILQLGIKRETIGDIIEYKENFYFACIKEISTYLLQNFKTIQHVPIELESVEDKILATAKIEDTIRIISSLRLDVILSSAYNMSRSESLEMITNGFVMVNHFECKNSSKIVKENDIISVRHKGRFCLKSIEGKTKTERLKVVFSFWI